VPGAKSHIRFTRRFTDTQRQEILRKSEECLWTLSGKPGLSYLKDKRCLADDVIKRFHIGYIPINVNHMLAGRLIFPIHDPSKNLIAISSRQINEAPTSLPVYWHESYEKSFYLYGINLSKEMMRKWGFSVLTEGQFDVLQFHNLGIKNAGGLCSTNLSYIHLSIIYRFCDEIVLVFDKDKNLSGQHAAQKILTRNGYCESGKDKNTLNSFQSPRHKITWAPIPSLSPTDPDEFIRCPGISKLKDSIQSKLTEMRNLNRKVDN